MGNVALGSCFETVEVKARQKEEKTRKKVSHGKYLQKLKHRGTKVQLWVTNSF